MALVGLGLLAWFVAAPSPAALTQARVVTLLWTTPRDADCVGTLLRFSTDGFPATPADGDPVPNGNDGFFPASPGAACRFTHENLAPDVTCYYAAFAFDEVPNFGAPALLALPPGDPAAPGGPAPAEEAVSDPAYFRVDGARPNPFHGVTVFEIEIRDTHPVRAEVYDAAGRSVATLIDALLPSGTERLVWEGRDRRGRSVPGGVYFVRVTTGRATITKKVLLVR